MRRNIKCLIKENIWANLPEAVDISNNSVADSLLVSLESRMRPFLYLEFHLSMYERKLNAIKALPEIEG